MLCHNTTNSKTYSMQSNNMLTRSSEYEGRVGIYIFICEVGNYAREI
jgi:hypothetical protein